MDEKFQLPVEYDGNEYMLNASLKVTGYNHKFVVEVNGQEIIFEPDEERNYRAVIPYEELGKYKSLDNGFLKAIAGVIEGVVN